MNTTETASETQEPLLRMRDVSVVFGGLRALNGVNLDVAQGERLAILGPNGAGKTTLFNVLAGDITPTEGSVEIRGVDCTLLPPRSRPQLGVARTYQKTRLFADLTVEDNLYLALVGKHGGTDRCAALRWTGNGENRDAKQPRRSGSAISSTVWSVISPTASSASSK